MKSTFLALLFLTVPFYGQAQPPASANERALEIGKAITLHSDVLHEDRVLNIYLPPAYHPDSQDTYPVLYLLDGSADEDFLHIAGLVQFFNMTFNMPPTIIVGIANVDRKRDFTFPTAVKADKEKYPTTGASAAFIRFMGDELQPYINAHFRTNDTKYVIGQSLGGLLATEVLLKRPELFTHYMIVSPSLWWSKEALLNAAPGLLAGLKQHPARIILSVGNEGKVMEEDARRLLALLRQYKAADKIDFIPMPAENHATILHLSIYKALQLLFPLKP